MTERSPAPAEEPVLTLSDIPPLNGPRPAGAARVRRRPPADPRGPDALHPKRRSVLGGLMAAGGSAGLSVLGVFGPAREALAQGYSLRASYYDIYQSCPSYASSHNCSPGCGPSLVCASCCRTSGSRKGFHHSSVSKAGYKLRPGQCYSGGWDGWKWAYANQCGKCQKSIAWRCHDGWKKNSSGAYYKTICRWAVSCTS